MENKENIKKDMDYKKECECEECKCECEDAKCKCEEHKCEECKSEECKCEESNCEECKCNCQECADIEKIKTELVQEKGERLALLAEFVNYKKRAETDKGDFIVYANSTLLKQIIEVIDDFDRALNGIDSKEKEIIEGVKMIHKKLTNLISSYGIDLLNVKEGDEFSPQNMEAITTVTVKDGKKHNKVMEVLQKGYINRQTGKIFKNAVVVIGKKV